MSRIAPLLLAASVLSGGAQASPLDFLVPELLRADRDPPELSITVTGYQYGWRYDYPNADKAGAETCLVEGALVLPRGKRIALSVTADDIIHEWRVPALDLATDAIPGLLNVVAFSPAETGVFRGGATSQSGSGYEAMAFDIKVIEPDAYMAWAKDVVKSCKAP